MKAAVTSPLSDAVQVTLRMADDGTGTLGLSGDWSLNARPPGSTALWSQVGSQSDLQRVAFDTAGLTRWDSSFVTAVLHVLDKGRAQGLTFDLDGLPPGAQRLIVMATAVPERQGARRTETHQNWLARLGAQVLAARKDLMDFVTFLGEAAIALGNCARGRARFRRSDLMVMIEDCGIRALPIVALISVLIGLILAFVGAIQLRPFGAQIYVADLVSIAMAREMGAIMTGIILAGRTGAAFAAQLGTMQVNEEIDAFRTLGFSPMEFLVLPRMLALILMMPLLTIYANIMGILGGAVVGVGMLGLTPTEYYLETALSTTLTDFSLGVIKSIFFGIIVAISGCLKGIQSGRSASAVGDAATSAVVMAIVLIIVFDGVFAVVTNVLGI